MQLAEVGLSTAVILFSSTCSLVVTHTHPAIVRDRTVSEQFLDGTSSADEQHRLCSVIVSYSHAVKITAKETEQGKACVNEHC